MKNLTMLTNDIKNEGTGAAIKWMEITTAAMAGNQDAIAYCAELLEEEQPKMADYWNIMSAARKLMNSRDIAQLEGETSQKLNAGADPKHDADKYLANKLGLLRRKAGMTQQELAVKSEVGLSTLQNLENGQNRILGARVEIVSKIASALGVTVEELIGEKKSDA